MWTFNNEEFTTEKADQALSDGVLGFVYLITHIPTGKKYVGKKMIKQIKKRPPLKGKKRKRIEVVQSDWKSYWSSSETLKEMVLTDGEESFTREILHLCKSKGELSYMELKEQMDRKVLFDEDYLNGIINVRINKSHLKGMSDGVCDQNGSG